MSVTPLDQAEDLIRQAARKRSGPLVVAIDGRSGTGKSTLAQALAERLGAGVIEGDDFYSGGTGIEGDPPQSRAARCIDWQIQRRVLTALQAGQRATYHAFDWDAFDGSREEEPTQVGPAPILILEGVYSARPELQDLLDLTILATVPRTVREARLLNREGEVGPWERQWHEAEDWYFAHAAPQDGFDLVLDLS